MISGLNYYARLGIPSDADAEEIRAAYFEAARRLHPDTNPSKDAADLFIRLQEAYDVLSHPEKRVEYNSSLPFNVVAPPPVSLTVQFSRSKLTRSTESQLIYALFDLTSISDLNISSSPSLNLCVVIDRSTSMQGERMDMVKANTLALIEQMRPHDFLSIVAFSDFAEVVLPPTRISDLKGVATQIWQLATKGSTEIFRGLEAGVEQVCRNLSPSFINHLILLTDGRTYGDEVDCLELVEQAYHRGVGISAFGIGEEWNDVFLDRLASLSGGSSAYISGPKDMQKVFLQKHTHLEKIYAERVTLHYQSDQKVELKYAVRLHPEDGVLSTADPIRLGNIIQFNNLAIVGEFLIQPLPEGTTDVCLARGFIKLEIPTRSVPVVRIKFDLHRQVVDEDVEDSPPQQLVQAISRLTLYRIQEKAREEVKTGAFGRATRHLQHLATHLSTQGEPDLAQAVMDEAEHIRQHQSYSKHGEKRIKYGTRALLLPPGPENESI